MKKQFGIALTGALIVLAIVFGGLFATTHDGFDCGPGHKYECDK